MKKILFLLDELPPTRSANGICINKIIRALDKDGYKTSCICWKAAGEYPAEIHLIPEKPWKQIVEKFCSAGPLGRAFFQLLRVAYRIKRIFMFPVWPVESYKTAKDYYTTAAKLIDYGDISVVVAVNYPGETLLAMKRLKKMYKEKIKTVMYPLDVSYVKPHSGKVGRAISSFFCPRFMRSCSRYADAVFVLENARDTYQSFYREKERDNFVLCGIPLLEPMKTSKGISTAGELRFVYAGTVQYKVRNPEVAFSMLGEIAEKLNRNIVFDIYGQMDRVSRELYHRGAYGFSLIEHGWVSEDEMESRLQEADILVNLGNAESHLIPSKLFKYMSTRKPIVHFCVTEKDPCIPYLEKYRNAILIYSASIAEVRRLIDWLRSIEINDSTNMIDLEKSFPRCFPGYTAALLEKMTK